jgi:hypothetical protein
VMEKSERMQKIEKQNKEIQNKLPSRLQLAAGVIGASTIAILVLLSAGRSQVQTVIGGASLAALAPAAFAAGVLSFLSPCTLPILPAYFAFTFQARKQNVVWMTIAFFLGLATTLTVLGASATALSLLILSNLRQITPLGGPGDHSFRGDEFFRERLCWPAVSRPACIHSSWILLIRGNFCPGLDGLCRPDPGSHPDFTGHARVGHCARGFPGISLRSRFGCTAHPDFDLFQPSGPGQPVLESIERQRFFHTFGGQNPGFAYDQLAERFAAGRLRLPSSQWAADCFYPTGLRKRSFDLGDRA